MNARVVVSSGESIATLSSFWRLADDEVGHDLCKGNGRQLARISFQSINDKFLGPACGWGSAKFPAQGEAGACLYCRTFECL